MLDLNNMSIVNRDYEYGNATNDGDCNNDTGSKRNCDESDDHRFVRDGKLSKIMSNHLRLHFNLCKLLSGTQKLNQDASNDANRQPLPPAQIQILPFPTCSPIKSSLVQFMPSSTIAQSILSQFILFLFDLSPNTFDKSLELFRKQIVHWSNQNSPE